MKKSKTRQRIHKMRGKYKHLDLMKGLIEARKEERQIPVADWQKESLDERQRRLIK